MSELWTILLPAALGLAAVYLLLPGPKGNSALLGSTLGATALLLAGWFVVRAALSRPKRSSSVPSQA